MLDILSQLSIERWAFQSLAMCLTALLIPGLKITSIFGPVLAVISLAFINAHLWDAALFFQLPNSATTQVGLLILTNGAIFWLIVKLLPGIETRGILPSIAAPIVFTVLSMLVEAYGKDVDWAAVFNWILTQLDFLKSYFLSVQNK